MGIFKVFGILIVIGGSPCVFGQTQSMLTAESEKMLVKAEADLTSICSRILTAYSTDREFLKNFKESQEVWRLFRTAELRVMFPDRAPGYYGSVHQMCVNDYLTKLTRERIRRLEIWLTGAVEGDVCAGSIKLKKEASQR